MRIYFKSANGLALGSLILSLSGGLGFADGLTIKINTKVGSEGLVHMAIFDGTSADKFPLAEPIFTARIAPNSLGKIIYQGPNLPSGRIALWAF